MDISDFQLKSLGTGAKNCIITTFCVNPASVYSFGIRTLGANIRKERLSLGFNQCQSSQKRLGWPFPGL